MAEAAYAIRPSWWRTTHTLQRSSSIWDRIWELSKDKKHSRSRNLDPDIRMSKLQYLFDWGDTLMADLLDQSGPMCDWQVVQLMPNALEALKRLSKTAPCHLATNAKDSQPEQIRTALRRVGLDAYISQIYCFRSVGHPKPSPSFFEFIQQDLQCEPAELVMVGDDLEGDIMGALKCGLQALWYNPKAKNAPPSVRHITDLMQLTTTK